MDRLRNELANASGYYREILSEGVPVEWPESGPTFSQPL